MSEIKRLDIDLTRDNPFIRAQNEPFFVPDSRRRVRTESALGLLYLLEDHNVIGEWTRDIVEFGAGFGDATIALNLMAEKYQARLDVVEIEKERAKFIVEDGILPQERVHITDGFGFLKRTTPGRVDLVFANLFGPDIDGSLFEDLLRTSAQALSDRGNVIITSESRTIGEALSVCFYEGLDYQYIPEIHHRDYSCFAGVVVNRKNAAKLKL